MASKKGSDSTNSNTSNPDDEEGEVPVNSDDWSVDTPLMQELHGLTELDDGMGLEVFESVDSGVAAKEASESSQEGLLNQFNIGDPGMRGAVEEFRRMMNENQRGNEHDSENERRRAFQEILDRHCDPDKRETFREHMNSWLDSVVKPTNDATKQGRRLSVDLAPRTGKSVTDAKEHQYDATHKMKKRNPGLKYTTKKMILELHSETVKAVMAKKGFIFNSFQWIC